MSADQSTIAHPLRGRVALVTGVSRRIGIGHTVAAHLANLGATVFRTGWPPHDDEMPWGTDTPNDADLAVENRNLEDPSQPAALIDAVVTAHGAIDIVIAVHARSSAQSLDELSGNELDRCWAANVRSIVLLAQQFAKRHDATRAGGRMIWFTSGQGLGPMPDQLPYTVTKAALSGMTASIAVPLADAGIVANCINPGPVDTGYATGDVHARVAARFPAGRWGTPGDVANLVGFLVSDEGAWIVGQVLNSEGGFRRS